MDYVALAIPAFFGLMGLEWAVSRYRGRPVSRFADWVGNLGCGIIQQTFKVVLALFTFLGYKFLYTEYRWLELDAGVGWVWLLCFLGVDFCYYWFHRMSHELNFLWAAHVVHHQSEEYNLGVALRQSAFQGAFSWVFYLPLALVGFPPLVFAVVASFNTLYQFWIHTQLIDRLGPLEWILNTPSHHRVHHGQNHQYIDRNHAGTLIIWDRLFGTFEPESEKVVYGVTEPPNRWNPIFANFHHWRLSWDRMVGARGLPDKLRVWLAPPGFVPPSYADSAKRLDPNSKYDTWVSRPMQLYVFVHFIILVASTTVFLFIRAEVDPWTLGLWGVSIVATAGLLGALLDGVTWVRPLEGLRPAVILFGTIALVPDALWAVGPVALFTGLAVLSALGWAAVLRHGAVMERRRGASGLLMPGSVSAETLALPTEGDRSRSAGVSQPID